MTRIRLMVGATKLAGQLDDAPAAADLGAMLPLDLNLKDFHGIGKVADLPRRLDTSAAPASYQSQAGDITLYAPWGNLAIFLAPYRESPGLVRLGRVDRRHGREIRRQHPATLHPLPATVGPAAAAEDGKP